jgi:hypothetical protein
VDLTDYALFEACLDGPGICHGAGACNPPGTANTDLDDDGDADLRDAALFFAAFAP